MKPSRIVFFLFILFSFVANPAHAACINPAGRETDIFYNSDYHTYQFCNGTSWMKYGGGSNCTPPSNYSPVAPSGTGYFVLTSTTYNGNLGGMFGANALCLTELTTNTNWLGYATANSNGQLVAGKVFAFLCLTNGWCQNLMPLTTYYFAHVGDAAAGGASFTTDSTGQGPGDNANWSGASYFNASTNYWSYHTTTSATLWSLDAASGNTCTNWTSSSSGVTGIKGSSAQTTQLRWTNGTTTCDTTLPILCVVSP